ncbi:hypothetical protein ES703_09403 [subsurface metagenome]
MKRLFAFVTVFICIFALSASAITPVDPWSSPQVTNSYSNNPITEDLSDMKVARAIGVENNPFYYILETLTFEERKNAHIDIEFMLPVSKSIEIFANEIENKWNSGYFDEALELFAELNEMEGVKGNALIGISWRTPIPAPTSDWGIDVQISTRDSVFVLAMDHHNSNDNLFAVLGFTGDGMGSRLSINISTNGGATWSETYTLGGYAFVMNDLDGCCVGNNFYIAYTGGAPANPNAMAWLKCFKATNGQQDTFPNGSYSFKVLEVTEITDVEISSNHDQYNNRLYFSCIEAGGITHFFWNDLTTVTWTGLAMNITDALQGYDMNWNLYFTNYALIISYINDANQVKIYGWDGTTFDNLYTYGINSTYYYYTTSCGGHDDTLFCAFNYYGTTYHLVQYLIQYGGGSWYYGPVSTTTENNYNPDATLRGAGGIHCVYRGPMGPCDAYYRWRPYSGGWSTHYLFNEHTATAYVRPEIEYVGSGAYGILYRTTIGPGAICYFDRSDAAVAESPAKTPATSFVKLYPNITKGKAHLSYAITKPGNVRLELFDVTGRLVKTLFNGYRRAGDYRTEVNASSITPGVYFMKINTPDGGFTERLTILK